MINSTKCHCGNDKLPNQITCDTCHNNIKSEPL